MADQLQKLSGVNVVLDVKGLEKQGMMPETPWPRRAKLPTAAPVVRPQESNPLLATPGETRAAQPAREKEPEKEFDTGIYGRGRMSLLAFTRFFLDQAELALVEQPKRLLITTRERAESEDFLQTRVYPVADLLVGSAAVEPAALIDRQLDREEAARKRIAAKLRRPISVDFKQTPLRKALTGLANRLDNTILVDRNEIHSRVMTDDVEVTFSAKDMPAKEVLDSILDAVGLKYTIDYESLVVTTPGELSRSEPRRSAFTRVAA